MKFGWFTDLCRLILNTKRQQKTPFCWDGQTDEAVSEDARQDEDAEERTQPVVRGPLHHLDVDDHDGDGHDDDDYDDDDDNA